MIKEQKEAVILEAEATSLATIRVSNSLRGRRRPVAASSRMLVPWTRECTFKQWANHFITRVITTRVCRITKAFQLLTAITWLASHWISSLNQSRFGRLLFERGIRMHITPTTITEKRVRLSRSSIRLLKANSAIGSFLARKLLVPKLQRLEELARSTMDQARIRCSRLVAGRSRWGFTTLKKMRLSTTASKITFTKGIHMKSKDNSSVKNGKRLITFLVPS